MAVGFGKRLSLALRVLTNQDFASSVATLEERPALPPAKTKAEDASEAIAKAEAKANKAAAKEAKAKIEAAEARAEESEARAKSAREDGALQLLAMLQRDGRFVDFVEQDVTGFSDGDVGAAARVVHEGCRKALRSVAKIASVHDGEEDAKVTVEAGYDARAIKLTGNVEGSGPFKGTLKHKGWRATDVSLPTPTLGHDATILAPAEVEL